MKNRITKQIFNGDYDLSSSNSWCSKINLWLTDLNLEHIFESKSICNIDQAELNLKLDFVQKWQVDISNKPKLRTYIKFKAVPDIENYVLCNLDRKLRSYIAQFRSGILPLEIETGRFRNIPLNERICKLCNIILSLSGFSI